MPDPNRRRAFQDERADQDRERADLDRADRERADSALIQTLAAELQEAREWVREALASEEVATHPTLAAIDAALEQVRTR